MITASFSYDNLCAKVTELQRDGVAVLVHDVASQFQQAHESLAFVRSIRLIIELELHTDFISMDLSINREAGNVGLWQCLHTHSHINVELLWRTSVTANSDIID